MSRKEQVGGMAKEEDSGSPSFFMQTKEDVAKAVATAMNSPRPSVMYPSKDNPRGSGIGSRSGSSSQLQRLQYQVTKMIKGFSRPSDVKNMNYNPEILTSQKRQWATNLQLQYMDHRSWKEPTKLFESMVVCGLNPNSDIQALQSQYLFRKCGGQFRVEPNIEPQVLFVYPPEKQLPLRDKDLLSFCFPGGVEVHGIEKSPSLSELNEILYGQEHIKQRDLSFVFRLQGADNSTLYGCCVLVEELVQKPSGLLSLISHKQPSSLSLKRYLLSTKRCYCILSRLPFFELHFGILNSIFMQERLDRLTKSVGDLNLEFDDCYEETNSEGRSECVLVNERPLDDTDGNPTVSQSTLGNSLPAKFEGYSNPPEQQMVNVKLDTLKYRVNNENSMPVGPETHRKTLKEESIPAHFEDSDVYGDAFVTNKLSEDKRLPNAILPLLRNGQYESSESSCSFQSSPCEDRNFRSDPDDTETEDASISGQDDLNDLHDILEWAKAHRSLFAEEEAAALSIWAVACICGTLRLENVLTFFAGALLEKQIAVVCSNLGILSASVLSVIPLIRPFRWQSLLMPVLPNDMLEFLDAPVPFVVGVRNKTNEVQSKLTSTILIDANRNQVRSPTIPQLPRQKELMSSLRPYHATLVGESYLGRKRPVYECTEVQVEAAKGFLSVLRSYLDSLCCNLRSHTITNVQSNDDKVSLLLKESFIDSFPNRDRAFMKLFVDTQLFSMHTDLVLSFFQKE
ncbi:uncharacterized protein LOC107624998 isoform X3 [Arachis ipaensis]|uniref:uncharacterized protein LOC107624998 isoform X3 n=1 Tax=Arachis ipaensis TaxID=130454 RepID=UPI000A2B499D|nr:uncharacterized protein LOC107624998 isoform X3 [Arachis ipaensis]